MIMKEAVSASWEGFDPSVQMVAQSLLSTTVQTRETVMMMMMAYQQMMMLMVVVNVINDD